MSVNLASRKFVADASPVGWTGQGPTANVLQMSEEETRALAQRLTQIREWRDLSPEELAFRAGVSPKTVYRIARGEVREPRRATIRQLATALEVEEDDLLPPLPPPEGLERPPVSSADQVESGFVEFRRHVEKLNEKLDGITGLLARQDKLLQKIESLAAGLPTDQLLEDVRQEIARLEERAEAAESEAPAASKQAGTARRRGSTTP